MTPPSLRLLRGDCLEVSEALNPASIDLVLCDPPYGTTACSWDAVVPITPMWEMIWRVLKPNRPVLLFGQEPFSSFLRVSEIERFKYDLYWRKSRPSGFTNARLRPLKDIEIISVFSEGTTANGSTRNMPYFPQGVGPGVDWKRPRHYFGDRGVNPARENAALARKTHGSNYPRQVLDFANPNKGLLHPTQKPVDLLAYLIRTYSRPGDVVLDFTMGSGSTGVACVETGRRFVGIEKDEAFFEAARGRVEGALAARDREMFE